MGFVKNFKDKINEHFVNNDYDEYESAVSDDDFEEASSENNNSSIYDNESDNSYAFNPQPGINVPEYSLRPRQLPLKRRLSPFSRQLKPVQMQTYIISIIIVLQTSLSSIQSFFVIYMMPKMLQH